MGTFLIRFLHKHTEGDAKPNICSAKIHPVVLKHLLPEHQEDQEDVEEQKGSGGLGRPGRTVESSGLGGPGGPGRPRRTEEPGGPAGPVGSGGSDKDVVTVQVSGTTVQVLLVQWDSSSPLISQSAASFLTRGRVIPFPHFIGKFFSKS